MEWKYSQTNAYPAISLHDCRACHAVIDGETIGFTFDDGFWITPKNELNPHDIAFKTDRSQLLIKGIELEDISIFKEVRLFGRTIFTLRKAITLQQLADRLNSGQWELEFVGEHFGYTTLYTCSVWFEKKPYHMECQLQFVCGDLVYSWNEMDQERAW